MTRPNEEEILGKSYDIVLMNRLLGYLKPYRLQVAISFAAILGISALQLAQPYLMMIAIDRHIAVGDVAGLTRIALLFLLILVGGFVLEAVRIHTMQMMGQHIMVNLRSEIFKHLQRLDLRFYDRNPVGRLITRVTTDVDVLNELFTAGVVAVFGDLFMLLGIMVVLLSMNWKLALITFSVLPLIFVVTHWFRRNARQSYRMVRVLIARINAFLQEHIIGMSTVQLFRQEEQVFQRFYKINRSHGDANIASIFYYAVFYPAIEVIGSVAAALILWYGGGDVLAGALSLGALVAFLQYSQRFFKPISDLSEKFNILQAAMASSERIFTLLDTPVHICSPENHVHRNESTNYQIIFDDVSFAYASDDYVLQDVSFEVSPGERVGIVGATGAGKTTLINLLLRFYDVNRGRVLVNGRNVREFDLQELRQMFGLVLQDVYLFSGTVEGNIRLGDEKISDAKIRQAAEAVHADQFIKQLPGQYLSVIAERGATLSVGQKQLLSFARALAFDPKILILDEATSSVDTQTEVFIRDALRKLMSGRTTLAIAHRLSTIQDMDKILVLHRGKVVEVGSHHELLSQRGLYYKLYQLQYEDQKHAPNPKDGFVS